MNKLKAEFAKTRNDNFVKNTVRWSLRVSEHRLYFFDNVRLEFEEIIFTNHCFKSGFTIKVKNNALNYI